MKYLSYYLIASISCLSINNAVAEIITLDNSGTTGASLDETTETPTTISVSEIDSLLLTVNAISGGPINVTATGMGINGAEDTDTDTFESAFNQSVSLSFNQTVSITQLDFTNFDTDEVFSFDGFSISYESLSNKTTDIYDFATPYIIAANTAFELAAQSGSIGIEGMTLTVVPEPSYTAALLITCGTALMLRGRRRPSRS
jgi:hypothetical protein